MSLKNVSILSPNPGNGRNAVALGVVNALSRHLRTSIFRPAVSPDETFTDTLLKYTSSGQTRAQAIGVTLQTARLRKKEAREQIVANFIDTNAVLRSQARVIVGSDKTKVGDPERFLFNADVSADLQSPVLLTVCTIGRAPDEVLETIESCSEVVTNAGTKVIGVFVTGCKDDQASTLKEYFKDYDVRVWTLPFIDLSDLSHADEAIALFDEHVPEHELMETLDSPFVPPTTPYAFQYDLLARAKADRKTIVLPEGSDDRIIQAADYLLQSDICDLIIIGEQNDILERGRTLGLRSLDKARFQSMEDEQLLAVMVDRLCELRAKKGMTPDVARKTLRDPNYFGTMLVVLGQADGLVSGAISSTANTVRPALQLIKTKPGIKSVSGAFLMCLKDHVSVFADCAINLDPDPEQLADIALQSAQTAKAFSVEPRVGMLSYSTLGSGKGPDVDLVDAATSIVRQKAPDLELVGPIQFDAAWSPEVASVKAAGNPVAGRVTVFVFPDLDSGNICYKAVQRTANAVAIGPILQGLNKPVNDLSRGALVQDIINTIALTAIEAQQND
ncbi:phosphate acetyltransferase [Bifidobacterium anseris]|uniref:Phosphate acetyltransferase n=1 Tax=Bifidobacterium anseris TaxID=2020963 RepID=A0A2N5J2E0_9BIFI|nr:phosphate acetyltransferase [Bifidobacterium anseris]PLS28353.1 phosphate acetyltransferase [Bifidobacterium anseris]